MQGISTGDPSWKTTAFAGKLCFDFNGAGCSRPKCKFNHKCAHCGTIGHGAQKCGKVESTIGPIHNKGTGCGKDQ